MGMCLEKIVCLLRFVVLHRYKKTLRYLEFPGGKKRTQTVTDGLSECLE